MLTKLFYEGPVATTKESFAERADFGRTMAIVLALVLLVAVPLLTWSLIDMAPLAEMHWGIATVVVTVKTLAWSLVVASAVGLVLAIRVWRTMRARLATIT